MILPASVGCGIAANATTRPSRCSQTSGAYFDRGPIDTDHLIIGGYWSVCYYNGYLYGSEIARGLDIFQFDAE